MVIMAGLAKHEEVFIECLDIYHSMALFLLGENVEQSGKPVRLAAPLAMNAASYADSRWLLGRWE